MRRLPFLSALLVLLPSMMFAQSSMPDNALGIFFDDQACLYCSNPGTYTTVTGYLILLKPTQPDGIVGWECAMYASPARPPVPWTVALVGGGVNQLAAPDYRVSLPAALPTANVVTLATISTFFLGGTIGFGLGPCHPANPIGSPAYLASDTQWRPLTIAALGGPGSFPGVPDASFCAGANYSFLMCGGIEGPGEWQWCWPVAAPNATWGTIKQLYR